MQSKIKEIEIGIIHAELHTAFKTSLRTVNEIRDVVVKIKTYDGKIGYGEAAPTAAITGETIESIVETATTIGKSLINKDSRDITSATAIIQETVNKNYSAKAMLEIAIFDLAAQYLEIPLYKMLGGKENTLSTDITISVNPISEMIKDTQIAMQRGFTNIKVKIGNNLDDDIKRLEAISNITKDTVNICLDVNQGWDLAYTKKAINIIKNKEIPIFVIEQPVKANLLSDLQEITKLSHLPIIADESAFSLKDAEKIISNNIADWINIKLMKCGGISQATKIIEISKDKATKYMMGCMLEGAISVGAAAHFAAAHKEKIIWIDLDGPALCKTNPVIGGTCFNEFQILLNNTPGLGIIELENFTNITTIV